MSGRFCWTVDIAPLFLNSGVVASFMLLSLYSRGKVSVAHWIEGWMSSRSGRRSEENILPLPGIEPKFLGRLAGIL
jgi:hypothetical protein